MKWVGRFARAFLIDLRDLIENTVATLSGGWDD